MSSDIMHLEEYKIFSKHVALLIRHHRQQRGLSQKRLAKLLDCTEKFLYYVERAERGLSFEMAFMIAEVLSIPLNWFAPGIGAASKAPQTLRERVMAKSPVVRVRVAPVRQRAAPVKPKRRAA